MAFQNRVEELAWLEGGWSSGRAELRALHGRRGIGKTALLDEFAAGKRRVVFQAADGTVADHLGALTDAILACQDDPVLRFWFRFVLPNQAQLEHGGSVERVYRTAVGPAFDQFVSKPTFGDICRAWVLDRVNHGDWPGVDRVGAWWGPIPDPRPGQPRRQTEGGIEVVAMAGNRVALAGEAKWTSEPVGFGVLEHLRRVVPRVPGADAQTELVLFGRAFDPRLVAAAESERLRLVSVDDLYA